VSKADEALIWAREKSVSKTYAQTYALAQAYRAGQAASAERIKALEHDLMWTDRAWEAAGEAVVYGYTLMDMRDARIKALEEENAALQELAGTYQVRMSDMLTRLEKRYPEDFVWLKEADQ